MVIDEELCRQVLGVRALGLEEGEVIWTWGEGERGKGEGGREREGEEWGRRRGKGREGKERNIVERKEEREVMSTMSCYNYMPPSTAAYSPFLYSVLTWLAERESPNMVSELMSPRRFTTSPHSLRMFIMGVASCVAPPMGASESIESSEMESESLFLTRIWNVFGGGVW